MAQYTMLCRSPPNRHCFNHSFSYDIQKGDYHMLDFVNGYFIGTYEDMKRYINAENQWDQRTRWSMNKFFVEEGLMEDMLRELINDPDLDCNAAEEWFLNMPRDFRAVAYEDYILRHNMVDRYSSWCERFL